MMDDALDGVFWRDEILQVMYWLRGEGLAESVEPQDLMTFLGVEGEVAQRHLDVLVDEGYLAQADQHLRRYELTERGIKEGGRRFADEFAELTRQAHGECNNPTCACRTLGPEACETRSVHRH